MTERDRTEYRRWARRRALVAESKKHGATDATAWARADAVYTADGYWRKTCTRCGQPFKSRRSDARLCGAVCRKRASRYPVPDLDNKRDSHGC